MSEQSHDKGCDCEHNHTERSHSQSTHHHDHGSDCECGCHHSEAENIIESALVFSKQGTLTFNPPLSGDGALTTTAEKIEEIAELIAVDGAVLGHVKALLDCAAGKATISITRLNSPDITKHDNWRGGEETDSGILSLNILSLANTDAPVEDAVKVLFA